MSPWHHSLVCCLLIFFLYSHNWWLMEFTSWWSYLFLNFALMKGDQAYEVTYLCLLSAWQLLPESSPVCNNPSFLMHYTFFSSVSIFNLTYTEWGESYKKQGSSCSFLSGSWQSLCVGFFFFPFRGRVWLLETATLISFFRKLLSGLLSKSNSSFNSIMKFSMANVKPIFQFYSAFGKQIW